MFLAFHPELPAGGAPAAPAIPSDSSAPSAPVVPSTPATAATPAPVDPSNSSNSFNGGGGDGLFAQALRNQAPPAAPAAGTSPGAPGAPPGAPVLPQPVAPAAPPPTPSPVMQAVAQLGLDPAQFPDDATAVSYLAQVAGEYRQMMPYAQMGYQMQPHLEQFRAWMQQQNNQAAPANQPAAQHPAAPSEFNLDEHFTKAWDVPAYDPNWEKLVQFNPQTGLLEPVAPGVPFQIVDAANKWRQATQSKQRDFWNNPIKQVWSNIEQPVEHKVRSIVNEMMQRTLAAQENQQFEQQHARHLYQFDQNGNVIVNPLTGAPEQTAFGGRFFQHARSLRAAGITDHRELRQRAYDLALGDVLREDYQRRMQQQQQPGQPGAPAPQAPAQAPPAPPADPRTTFMQSALQRASHNPSAVPAGASPSEPVSLRSYADLEGMFEREARTQGILR